MNKQLLPEVSSIRAVSYQLLRFYSRDGIKTAKKDSKGAKCAHDRLCEGNNQEREENNSLFSLTKGRHLVILMKHMDTKH